MEQAAIGSQFRYLNKSFGIMVILAQPLPSLFFSLDAKYQTGIPGRHRAGGEEYGTIEPI